MPRQPSLCLLGSAPGASATGIADEARNGRLGDALHQALALDDALGNVARDLVGDRLDSGDSASTTRPRRVSLQEAVGAAVAAHGDVAHRVDPEPRLQAGRDGEIEEVDIGGHVGKDRREFRRQQVEPHAACLAQFDDDVVAVGRRVLDVADGVGQAPRRADRWLRCRLRRSCGGSAGI